MCRCISRCIFSIATKQVALLAGPLFTNNASVDLCGSLWDLEELGRTFCGSAWFCNSVLLSKGIVCREDKSCDFRIGRLHKDSASVHCICASHIFTFKIYIILYSFTFICLMSCQSCELLPNRRVETLRVGPLRSQCRFTQKAKRSVKPKPAQLHLNLSVESSQFKCTVRATTTTLRHQGCN